jgi:hypothetical protein
MPVQLEVFFVSLLPQTAPMFAPTALSREPSAGVPAPLSVVNHRVRNFSCTLTVARVGYLTPTTSFDAVVHSVFARACNFACDFGLLTVAAPELSDGPTVWRLAGDTAPDFRHLFDPGERLRRRQAVAFARAVMVDLERAATWRPSSPPPISSGRLCANLQRATAALDCRRHARSSVIDREAQASLRSLEDACRRLDVERATGEIRRLVGWGEGLTPAGDDALVGLLASLGALACADANKLSFLQALSDAVVARVTRTTVVSAHYLRLAAQGHFNADVTDLTDALLAGDGGDDDARLRAALETALDVGATSGADMVTGMIAGFRVWCPANR